MPQTLRYVFLIIFLMPYQMIVAQDFLFNTRHLTVEDGLLGRRVNSIIQDKEGFMWIATNEGLNRFDGYSFQYFTKSSHGLSANNIFNLGIDDVGDVWITYYQDNFIAPETQIIRPKTGEILSLKEKLGSAYKKEYQKLRLNNGVNIKQIFLTLPKRPKLLVYKNQQLDALPNSQIIYSPYEDKIYSTNKDKTTIIQYNLNGEIVDSLRFNPSFNLSTISFTQNGGIWALGENKRGHQIYYKSKTGSTLNPILKFSTTKTYRNLSLGFWENGHLHFEYRNQLVNFDVSEMIERYPRRLTPDRQGNMWIATNDGVIILSIKPQRFQQYLKDGGQLNSDYDSRGIWSNNELMYAFSGRGTFRHNLKNETKEQLFTKNKKELYTHTVTQAKDGTLWVGAKNSHLLNLDTQTGKTLATIQGTTKQIWSLLEDKNNRVWIGQANHGLYYFEKDKMKQSQKYTQLNGFDEIGQVKITQIIADKRDNNYLWLACQSGWYRLHLKEGVKERYWEKSEDDNFKIPADEIHFTYQDANGDFWLATAYSGLIKVTLNPNKTVANSEQFTIEEGLTSNTIYAVYEDEEGFLWMSTNNGINRLNKKTYEVQAFLEEDGLPHYEFNRLSSFQREDGTLFFGTLNGIVSFHPDDLKEIAAYNVPLAISKCEKYDDDLAKMANVTAEVLTSNRIVIRPNERLATLYVSLQNYSTSLKTKYVYRIKGLQEEFVPANKNEITLNGLPYGKYTLEVKAKAPDGRFSKQMISIPLIVKRPFYLQWWFILLAIVSLALAIWQIFQTRTRVLQNRKRELEEIVKDRTIQLQKQATQLGIDKNVIEVQAKELQSLDKMKSRFFANISHELRTPLTLILSPAQSIIKRQKTDNRDFTSAQIIEQNAQKLLKRINEILDLTKLEAKEMQLKPQLTPFYEFIKRLVANFEGFATEKGQQLTFNYQLDKKLNLQLDQDKYEHIFNNYLSNAIKFTPKGGKINIQLFDKQEKNSNDELENLIVLSVEDNGQGVPKSDLKKVFDRFFQSKKDVELQDKSLKGSGIGLALSKEIAQLMKGNVRAESEIGKGSTFYFEMPFVEELTFIDNEQWAIDNEDKSGLLNFQSLVNVENTSNTNKPTILLVEDNTQLRNYIQLILQERYNVITAENGKEALEAIKPSSKQTIQLILSDIMMPVMDGFELLDQLKSSDTFCHIPVVMLTARSNAKDKLKALRIGVDDYILKPFQEEELMARIDNLIVNAKNRVVKEVATQAIIKKEQETSTTITAVDIEWLEQIEKRLKKEISNSKFNVESLSTEFNISRSKLQRRIKKMTGLTPVQYLRDIKLQAARELLENKQVQTINEVAYAVGFDTPAYFTKIFTKHFGKKPIEYLK